MGDGCIVGTQAVVTKGIPSQSIVCGNPAKIVKSGIRRDRQRIFNNN